MKQLLFLGLKIVALTIIMFFCFAAAAGVVQPPAGQDQTASEQGTAALILLFVCFLNATVLSYIILRSRWAGWKLIITMFAISYGVMTFMAQIESAVFITRLPAGMVPRLFLMGVIITAPFSVLAVLMLGKRKAIALDDEASQRLKMPINEWIWKLALLAGGYVVLYFTFGYFIAWQNPAVREYYGGTDSGNFFVQMGIMLRDQPWLVALQILRGLMWVGLALPVIQMHKGERWETALTIGLLFAIVMNTQLLLPNPYMPESVRLSHLIETATSNFIFGGLVGWLLCRSHGPALAAAIARP